MRRMYLILCAMGIALSCHAQFFSADGDLDSLGNGKVNDQKIERNDSLLSAVQQEATADSMPDFRQRMVNLWMSVSMPLDRMQVTSHYGKRRHPIYRKVMDHNGMDFSAPVGTKVYAMMDGIVKQIGYDGRSGKFVIIDHGEYTVSYCHLSRVLVTIGEHVKAGQITCLSGNTGASTGPHVHYGLRDRDGKWCDPKVLLDLVEKTRKTVLSMIRQYVGTTS